MVQIGPNPPKIVADEPMLWNYCTYFDENLTIRRAVVWNGAVFYSFFFFLVHVKWSKLVQILKKEKKHFGWTNKNNQNGTVSHHGALNGEGFIEMFYCSSQVWYMVKISSKSVQ